MNVQIITRIPSELHTSVKNVAKRRGLSVNSLINALLSETVESDRITILKVENQKLL